MKKMNLKGRRKMRKFSFKMKVFLEYINKNKKFGIFEICLKFCFILNILSQKFYPL